MTNSTTRRISPTAGGARSGTRAPRPPRRAPQLRAARRRRRDRADCVARGLSVRRHRHGCWLCRSSAFVALAVWHDRVIRAPTAPLGPSTFYEHGIARLEDRWQGIGETGARFLTEDHLYARDLDIFGPGSLFQLLSLRPHAPRRRTARTLAERAGAAPPAVRSVRKRSRELREALDFREALATAGGASRDIDTVALSAWASAPAAPESLWLRMRSRRPGGRASSARRVWWVRAGPRRPSSSSSC